MDELQSSTNRLEDRVDDELIAAEVTDVLDDARRRLVSRLEDRADDFRDSFEDHMNKVVETFEQSLDDLSDRVERDLVGRPDDLAEKDVLVVMNNALAIEDYVRRYRMTPRARSDWARVKAYLDDFARTHNVTWAWTVKPGGSSVTATDATTPTSNP